MFLSPGMPGIYRYFLMEETYKWCQFYVIGRGEGCRDISSNL